MRPAPEEEESNLSAKCSSSETKMFSYKYTTKNRTNRKKIYCDNPRKHVYRMKEELFKSENSVLKFA